MEASPLVQQARPTAFVPKIVQLYDDLFDQPDKHPPDSKGFWNEFFLLKADRQGLQERLETVSATSLLHLHSETQQLFTEALAAVKNGQGPADENALDTLLAFLVTVLPKKFTNPSADIISIVAGLDRVDQVFNDFADILDSVIRNGRSAELRHKAVGTALAMTAGAYQTSLVSYFTHKDLFPALVKYIHDSADDVNIPSAFLLLGVLANYNKFEFRNPYRLRMQDYVNETTINSIIRSVGAAMSSVRGRYIVVQDDAAEPWKFGNTLGIVGLGKLVPSRTPSPAPVEVKEDIGDLPDAHVAIMLATCEFCLANKLFCRYLVACAAKDAQQEAPFASLLSSTSYILHHAFRSVRATSYGLLSLLILRILVEDLGLCKLLCDTETATNVRLCRQRQPLLPLRPKARPWICSILDIIVDAINHNLRRNLDIPLYTSLCGLLHRLIAYLTYTRTRLSYDWSLLWQTQLAFLRFATTYIPVSPVYDRDLVGLFTPLLETMALSVVSGETFLPDAASYDDLFYKLVESGESLGKFKSGFGQMLSQSPEAKELNGSRSGPLDLLLLVSAHYHDLVESERKQGRLGNNPSPREVSKIIRSGYESLALPAMNGLDRWNSFREVDERSLLKRAARIAVDDTRSLLKSSPSWI